MMFKDQYAVSFWHKFVFSSCILITTLVCIQSVFSNVLFTSNPVIHFQNMNGLLGIVFGWLYWKRGLEAAMISHFSADIVLHVLLAL